MQRDSLVYPWQQNLWQQLLAYLELNRIPQALLVSGGEGVGKRHLVEAFSAALLCHAPLSDLSACGTCQACILKAAQTHPDYLCIEPEEIGKTIGIDKIRQLIVKLALKPHFEAHRVVIVQPAEHLNMASANAFLKCLEEPTERTCLILVTDKPHRLPATIRSRCQTVHCKRPETLVAEQWLRQQGVNQDHDLLLHLAHGGPLLAKAYADQDIIPLRNTYFSTWVQILEHKQNLITVAEQWHKQDKLELKVLLTWMISWVMDIIKSACHAEPETLFNPDMKKTLHALAQRLELKQLYKFYDSLLLAQSQLTTQINKQLLIEQFLIDWMQLNSR